MIRLLLLTTAVSSQDTLLLSQIEGLHLANDLGKDLRPKLIDNGFLDPRYIPSESYFRSSASGRVMITAAAVGSALFNPVNLSIPNQVNVQTMSSSEDWLCVDQNTPWLVEQMYNAVGKEYTNASSLEKLTMELMSNWTANSILSTHLTELDTVPIEKEAGLPVPDWFDDAAETECTNLRRKYYSFYTGTGEYHHPQWTRCRSGLLLYTLMQNIQRKVSCGSSCNTPKFHAYATHDFVMQSLLGSFGLVEEALRGGIPPFTGAILTELWQSGNSSYVKLFWRSPRSGFVSLTSKIGSCAGLESCPVDPFTSCCSDYSSADPQTDCNYPSSPGSSWSLALIVLSFTFF